jgi:hypothetical protein
MRIMFKADPAQYPVAVPETDNDAYQRLFCAHLAENVHQPWARVAQSAFDNEAQTEPSSFKFNGKAEAEFVDQADQETGVDLEEPPKKKRKPGKLPITPPVDFKDSHEKKSMSEHQPMTSSSNISAQVKQTGVLKDTKPDRKISNKRTSNTACNKSVPDLSNSIESPTGSEVWQWSFFT